MLPKSCEKANAATGNPPMTAQIIQFRPRANPNRDRLNELKRMAEELLARIQIPTIPHVNETRMIARDG
jgi:hypothetical protein